ncbi:uncharacterized protein LOC129797297 [Lutzomyia longipalpis]|uniref:uncharacterized protein LOC129797297 n=1 Tax=Lutzomyia longipalpis TaxID=7200 RepID=UPI002483AD7A|nr:uncharacterized protein LOC129797297 [Lutzomyia longipalpis]
MKIFLFPSLRKMLHIVLKFLPFIESVELVSSDVGIWKLRKTFQFQKVTRSENQWIICIIWKWEQGTTIKHRFYLLQNSHHLLKRQSSTLQYPLQVSFTRAHRSFTQAIMVRTTRRLETPFYSFGSEVVPLSEYIRFGEPRVLTKRLKQAKKASVERELTMSSNTGPA